MAPVLGECLIATASMGRRSVSIGESLTDARRQAGLPGRPEPAAPMFEAFELAEDVEG